MDSDKLADALADGQVVELVGEENDGGVLHVTFLVNRARGIGNLDRGDKTRGLEALVREGGVKHNAVDVGASVANLAIGEGRVGVLSTGGGVLCDLS